MHQWIEDIVGGWTGSWGSEGCLWTTQEGVHPRTTYGYPTFETTLLMHFSINRAQLLWLISNKVCVSWSSNNCRSWNIPICKSLESRISSIRSEWDGAEISRNRYGIIMFICLRICTIDILQEFKGPLSPDNIRVNSLVSQMPDFSRVFACQTDDLLYSEPVCNQKLGILDSLLLIGWCLLPIREECYGCETQFVSRREEEPKYFYSDS